MSITKRIDAITAIPEGYRQPCLPAPRSVKIEVTGRCNFRCSFCARSAELRDQKDMDMDLFQRLCLEMAEGGVEELGLFYLGESTMLPNLEEYIGFADGLFDYLFLTTNGSILTPNKARAYFEAGLDSLKFSLNYADAEQFADIARVKPVFFDRMIENIKAAWYEREHVERASGHRCGLYASFIQYDGEQARKMAAVVEQVRPYLDEVYALPLYSQATLVEGEERERGWDVTAGNRGRLDAMRDPLPCWAVFTEGHITWDGKLSACCFDHDGRFEMADLTQVDFMTGWNSAVFQALRAAHLRRDIKGTPCEGCVAYV